MLLQHLPSDVIRFILSTLDVPSVCRFSIALLKTKLKDYLIEYLDTREILVTPEILSKGELEKIDFYTLAKLPPCDVVVYTPAGLLELAKWHLRQVTCKLVTFVMFQVITVPAYPIINDLGSNVKSMEFGHYVVIDPKDIPLSVTRLCFADATIKSPQNFRHLVNLTTFKSFRCDHDASFKSPLLITDLTLHQVKNSSFVFDAYSLNNLKNVMGHCIVRPRYANLEKVLCTLLEKPQSLPQIKEWNSPQIVNFKQIDCPKLVQANLPNGATGDVSDFLNDDQMGKLRCLISKGPQIRNVHLLHQLKTLHIKMNAPLTTWFPLPPNVVELKVWQCHPVEGIPPQIETFDCEGLPHEGEPLFDVDIRSEKLRSFKIDYAMNVNINCPKLTNLELRHVATLGNFVKLDFRLVADLRGIPMNEDTEERLEILEQLDPVDDILVDDFIYIENFYVPNVVKLDLTMVPTFPYKLVPKISQLRLTMAKQDVVIEERLKLI